MLSHCKYLFLFVVKIMTLLFVFEQTLLRFVAFWNQGKDKYCVFIKDVSSKFMNMKFEDENCKI